MNLVYPWTNAYYMTPGHVIDLVRFCTMHLGSADSIRQMNACNQTISSAKLIRYVVYFWSRCQSLFENDATSIWTLYDIRLSK